MPHINRLGDDVIWQSLALLRFFQFILDPAEAVEFIVQVELSDDAGAILQSGIGSHATAASPKAFVSVNAQFARFARPRRIQRVVENLFTWLAREGVASKTDVSPSALKREFGTAAVTHQAIPRGGRALGFPTGGISTLFGNTCDLGP